MLNIIAVLVLFGVTWVFGALTVQKRHELFEFLFVVSNSLQGFYVFVFFVVLAKETRELWLETCGCRKKKKEEPDAPHMESVPGTPTVTRVPSLRKTKPFNIDEYGKRLEELTIDTPDTRKRMNSWDIMYVMPKNQFHILLFSDNHELQKHPEHQEEEDLEKEMDLPSSVKDEGESNNMDNADNRSTADSGIMDDKGKTTPSPTAGRSRFHEMSMSHPQSGVIPVHVHSVSGIGYVSDDSTEDVPSREDEIPIPITFKQAKSHDIELGRQMSIVSSSGNNVNLDRVETSNV